MWWSAKAFWLGYGIGFFSIIFLHLVGFWVKMVTREQQTLGQAKKLEQLISSMGVKDKRGDRDLPGGSPGGGEAKRG